MPNKLITELPLTSAVGTSVVPVSDAAGTVTNKVTLADIAALGGGTPGDNTVTSAKLVNSAVTYEKIQNVSATDRILGRSSVGAGVVEEITCTVFGRSLLAAVDAATARTTLAAAATASPAFTGQVTVAAGSAATPAIAPTGDTNTGLYFPAADTLALVTSGADRLRVDASGNAAINATPSAAAQLLVARTDTNTSATFAYSGTATPSITAAGNYLNFVGSFIGTKPVSAGITDSGYIIGVRANAWADGAGTLDSVNGVRASGGATSTHTGILNTAAGLWATVSNLGAGTITTGYGVYIGTVAGTTGYGLYQAAANNANYFAGRVGIGTTSPTAALDLTGVMAVSSGTAAEPTITLRDSGSSGLYFPAANTVAISTSGVERFRIASDGTTTISNLAVTNSVVGSVPLNIAEGRLTILAGNPAPAGDVTGATTLYYTPAVGNKIALYNVAAASWQQYTFSEISLSLAGRPANTNYDVFVFNNAGTLTLALTAWTNATTRVPLSRLNGVLVSASNSEHRYVGTIRTTVAGTSEDSVTQRFVWNYNNQVLRRMVISDSTAHTYAGTTNVLRPWRNLTTLGTTRVQFVTGELGNGSLVNVPLYGVVTQGGLGLALDSTTVSLLGVTVTISTAANLAGGASQNIHVPAGYHYFQGLESGYTGLTTTLNQIQAYPTFWG